MQYNFDSNNAALLAPVAEFTSTALLQPAAAMTRAAFAPVASAALAATDAIARTEIRTVGGVASQTMTPLRAGIQRAINQPLSAALGPAASSLPGLPPQPALVAGGQGIVRQIAQDLGAPRRTLLQLASALLPDPEDDDVDLPMPRVRLVDEPESGSGEEVAPASRTALPADALPSTMTSEDGTSQVPQVGTSETFKIIGVMPLGRSLVTQLNLLKAGRLSWHSLFYLCQAGRFWIKSRTFPQPKPFLVTIHHMSTTDIFGVYLAVNLIACLQFYAHPKP